MKKKVLSALLVATMTVSMVACGSDNGTTNNDTPADNSGASTDAPADNSTDAEAPTATEADLSGTYDVTVWVSESEGVAQLTEQQIDAFEEANPGIVINATVEGVTESNSASNMITDVASGADLFCFAQDQLIRLVEAGALTKLGTNAASIVTESNDATSLKAATVGSDIYCYPLTSDNGYFMFYDKSVVQESSLDDLAAIVADCEAAGRTICMETDTSAWYVASFFFATGCHSDWTMAEDGTFTSVDDDFDSANGLIALKGMQQMVKSDMYVSSSDAAQFAAAVPAGVVVTGTWGVNAAKEALGDNYAVTDLPSFTVDGTTYHMGSYSGCKLMGVKPQDDAVKSAVLHKLAQYLTSAECQLQRYELVGWGPSNLEAQQSDEVQADPALAALAAQNEFATPQGQIHGSWWDIAKLLGNVAEDSTTDEELQAGLDSYKASIDGLFTMDEATMNAFTLIGSFGGYNWDTDVAMTEDPAGTWTATVDFKAGDEFKVRQGLSWDVNFGADGVAGGDNVVIDADGTYLVTLVYDGTNATLTVEAQ
ncbi:MAG: extracellular solute-binding protein [Agathobacter sp.]|nr:extracellular solute-binding protein [Agathobacter sp.]